MIFFVLLTLNIVILGVSVAMGWAQMPTMRTIYFQIFLMLLFVVVLHYWFVIGKIVWGFSDLAAKVTGQSSKIGIGSLIWKGFTFLLKYSKANLQQIGISIFHVSLLGLVNVCISELSAFGVFAGYLIIALQYGFIMIEVTMAIALGPVLISFLPFKATRVYAERYFSFIFKLGFEVFFFFCAFSLIHSSLSKIYQNINGLSQITAADAWGLAFMAILSVFILAKIPGKFADAIADRTEFSLESLLKL
jgi:type IV secretory pathway VirB6-like protein